MCIVVGARARTHLTTLGESREQSEARKLMKHDSGTSWMAARQPRLQQPDLSVRSL